MFRIETHFGGVLWTFLFRKKFRLEALLQNKFLVIIVKGHGVVTPRYPLAPRFALSVVGAFGRGSLMCLAWSTLKDSIEIYSHQYHHNYFKSWTYPWLSALTHYYLDCAKKPLISITLPFHKLTMAKDGEPLKPVDKGKGKAVEGEPSKAEEVNKDKDGKPILNGKKEDGVIGGKAEIVALKDSLLMCSFSTRRAQ
jgi:hypothetical protein